MKKILSYWALWIMLFVAFMTFSKCAHAAEKVYPNHWYWYDTVLEVGSEALLYYDWKQTREFTGSPQEYPGMYETNKYLGEHPTARRVNTYFIAWLALHPVISYYLPQPLREGFQGTTIWVEKDATNHNRTTGVKVDLKLF